MHEPQNINQNTECAAGAATHHHPCRNLQPPTHPWALQARVCTRLSGLQLARCPMPLRTLRCTPPPQPTVHPLHEPYSVT
jgi:hypothetical protein